MAVASTTAGAAFGTGGRSATLSGSIVLVDQQWYCTGPVNLTSVTVTIRTAQTDAIHLSAGCTGTIGRINVVQYHGDGVIVGPGAHDLTIGGGTIRCYGHDPGKHQDGIQAMGGQRVTFNGLDDQCLSANNSALFINEGGSNIELPTDIVCSSCYLAGAGFPVRIALSLRSGIRNSRICAGQFGSVRISPGIAQSPVNVGTVIVRPGTGGCAGGPPQPPPPPPPPPTTTTLTTTTETTSTTTTEPTKPPKAPEPEPRHKHHHQDG
jgi:hypothetical protein